MRGKNYTNNSVMNIAEVGRGKNALLCMTDRECCCGIYGHRSGQFYYPNGRKVPIQGNGDVFYRDRREKMIRLNRNRGYQPTGMYRCEIPDASGVIQKLYFTFTAENSKWTPCLDSCIIKTDSVVGRAKLSRFSLPQMLTVQCSWVYFDSTVVGIYRLCNKSFWRHKRLLWGIRFNWTSIGKTDVLLNLNWNIQVLYSSADKC